jgi:trans-2-enoyl-CoA reductase
MRANRLDDLPFDEVQMLYCKRLYAEKDNDIKERTRLLRDYPELFEPEIWAELELVFKRVVKFNRRKKLLKLIKITPKDEG